jgi:maltooligosyltrehalose trehalohydrolase
MITPMNRESKPPSPADRRYPVGAEVTRDGVHFRLWAPEHKTVQVVPDGDGTNHLLEPEGNGYFSGLLKMAAGSPYRFRLDSGLELLPDPASRFQPEGPFGWSQVVDPTFAWTDDRWRGCKLSGQILYEMHIGTFTKEGTFRAAEAELAELAAIGITVLEIMPVADFPGSFGWGYDGVNFFAPSRLYGTPDDFRHFVNSAHKLGLGVILDVVYNHAGPSGNFLGSFTNRYFTDRYKTDWGAAINYDGEDSAPVREFFLSNAAYWIDEFHLDGLRLDATQNIYDAGPTHILEEIGRAVRKSARGRDTIVVAENEPQDSHLVRPHEQGGYSLDGMWNDDFHHSAMVALTGRNEAYYTDYSGHAQELLSAFKYGFLYQGQYYQWQKKPRGTPSWDLNRSALVVFLQNHDQIANSARGDRVDRLASPACFRAMSVMLLLAPGTPMLFQGQEFGASAPFRFFSDHEPELSKLVAKGRAEFMSQFRSFGSGEVSVTLRDPGDPNAFSECKLDFSDRERHAETYALHKDVIQLRKTDPVFKSMALLKIDGAVLSDETFLVRYFGPGDTGDRVLIVNLGMDLHLKSIPEPLLAPPLDCQWQVLFSSENPKYGGGGIYLPDGEGDWNIPGESAIVLSSCPGVSASNER